MYRLTGAAQDAVLEEVVMLVGEDRTLTTVDVEVCKGVVVTPTPPPLTKTDREFEVAVRTVSTEVGCRKK